MQVDLAGAREFGIKCRGEAVTYSAEKGTLTCLGKEAKVDAENGRLTLRILVDRTSMEVFANDGKVSMSSCFLPGPENAGLELFSTGGNPKILSMTVCELKSIWPKSRVGNEMRGDAGDAVIVECLLFAPLQRPAQHHALHLDV